MDLIFEILLEIIMELIVEAYTFAMMRISDKNKKINKDKIQVFVVFECIAIFVLFIVGGVMLLETNGESLVGKIVFASFIVISAIQISIGLILNKRKKNIKRSVEYSHLNFKHSVIYISASTCYTVIRKQEEVLL